jgi:hypothetical protein
MKRSLVLTLIFASGFCAGYLLGVPFFKTQPLPSSTRQPEKVENLGQKFSTFASSEKKQATSPPKGQKPTPKPATPPNLAAEIASLSLAEVHSRLQAMNGMQATAATDEMDQLLVSRWSKLDPIGASEFAAAAVAEGGNPRLLQTATAAWAKTDPAGAAQWAANLDSPLARDTAIGQIFNTWSSTDPLSASTAIDALRFLNHPSKPVALPLGSAQTVATAAVAKNFIKANPYAALKWAERLTGPLQVAATREIVTLWSVTDPAATGAWILKQPSQQIRNEALGQLARNWVVRDPGTAFDYAPIISDPSLRNRFMQSAMQRFSSMDPVAAANWLFTEAATPHADSLVSGVSSSLAAFDPGAASVWATSITDSNIRNKAVSAVSTSWAQNNLKAAAGWISSLRDPKTRDVATAAFSVQMAKTDPAAAAQWASRISDPAQLKGSLQRIVGDWKKIDPNSARLFVQSSTALPAEFKQKLLR